MYNFVHFRLHSEYSIESSIIDIKKIISKAKNDKQNCLCITDTNNLFNAIRFYKECLTNKIKPLIGCDLNIKINSRVYKIIILLKNQKGYLNISKLLSRILIYNKDFIELEWFKGSLKKNLILLFNFNSSYYKKNYNIKYFIKDLKILNNYFKNNIYLEIQKYKNKNYEKIIHVSSLLKIPLLATHPIVFINKNDFLAYKAKISIYNKNNNTKNNIKNNISKKYYFYSKKKMIKIFKDIPFAIKNTYELSKRCNFVITFNKIKLPFLKTKKNNNLNFIKKLKKKLKNLNNLNYQIYKKRLIYELKTIIKMNLVDYFLIVSDFINWSKKKNIQVGPGRGSSAGSLISFLLNITELDPIKYNLLFERFLNIERISIPDFDIDFCQNDRERVIKYIKKKYGISFISQIITFNKMAPKICIKDVGKFLNFNYDFINEINKLISLNYNLNILEILKSNKKLYYKYKRNIKVRNLINLSIKLEGLTKNIGIHSGGVIISPNKIFYHSPLLIQKNIILNQYFKDDIEEIGILKFDFLGLTTLSIIKNCLKNIKKKIILKKINLNDKLCYKNLTKGNTIGVFQLESKGIRNVLKKAKPECFENITAIISLYRPGPIKLIDDFCLKKSGKKKIIYIDKKLKKILQETYGIIIYQEQIMEIVKIIGNYSLNEADILRKIISKKKKNEMMKQEKIFIERSLNNRNSYKKSFLIFNLIKEFVNYGFNKSHATAYSLLTYQTMWLKTHYPEYYISANLTYCFDVEKIKIIINDAKFNNVYILPININLSNENFFTFENQKNKKIRYGFKGITGLGYNIIKSIIKERNLKPFKNFLNFYKRVDKSIVNYKSIEILICCGSFDSINYNRSNLIKKLNILSKINFKKKENLIKNLYFKKNYYWKFKKKILEEKNIIGFFFLNNIYNIYRKRVKNYMNYKFLYKGIIIDIKDKIVNNNFTIYIIDEKDKEFEIKINKNLFEKNIKIIKKYNFIIVENKSNSKIISAKKIISMKNVKNKNK